MTGKRALTFPIGKVGIDGTVTTTGTVTLGPGTATYGKLAANSGVDIGDVDVTSVSLAPSVYTVAEKTDLSTSNFQLASNANTYGVRITNTSTNGNIVYVGDTNITATRFLKRLYPGEDAWFEVSNSNLLYVRGSAASTAFTYGGY